MAKQQQLVPLFSRENAYAVPYYGLLSAIILTGAMLLAYHYSGLDLEGLIAYANGLFILIYLAASLAGTKLLTGINRNLALLASATCLVLFISLATHALFAIGLLLLLSLYYRLKSKKRS